MEIDEDEKKSAETFVRQLSEFSDYIKIRIRGTATDKKTKYLLKVDRLTLMRLTVK